MCVPLYMSVRIIIYDMYIAVYLHTHMYASMLLCELLLDSVRVVTRLAKHNFYVT